MKFQERLKRIKLFLNMDKELQLESLQLEELQQKITENKNELKDFINSNLKEEFKDCDYEINITHCYIISINGKNIFH